MQNDTCVEWTQGLSTTTEVTWREFCSSVWQIPAQHSPSPQPEPPGAQLLSGRESWEAGDSLPSSNACLHNLHFEECPFIHPSYWPVDKGAGGMRFPRLEARWGESLPEVCLCLRDFACSLSPQWHVKLCSPKTRVQEAVWRGRRRIQKWWKSCKIHFLWSTETGFSRLEEPILFNGKITNSNGPTIND